MISKAVLSKIVCRQRLGNPLFKNSLRMLMTDAEVSERVDRLLLRERSAISRTITLIESSLEEHRDDADKVMKELFKRTPERRNHPAIRIGLCGSPGAGKSSLIEKLGLYIS